ncbi:hypothetical protein M407DRAFT_219784 [Tulasnella calospora MUT 4182]|uniref:DUF6533 domain-containing protein n=1 Tax=Tulasnella calospora MUT 4182 TaxID=1051891 RepID=A0A0C3QRN6_9AGAM|nr:hypothetical protein M407DRAFT_219784 [Tulasnella calospora MUT 4182]
MFSSDDTQPLQDTITSAYGGRGLSYLSTACFAWLLWDWVINFEEEHRLIWGLILLMYGVRWTTPPSCVGLKWVVCFGSFAQIFVLQVLLQGRVYVLYNCSRTILYINVGVSILSVTGFLSAFAFLLPRMSPIGDSHPVFGCWSEISRDVVFIVVPAAVYDLWLWLLVTFKAFNQSQDRFSISSNFKSYPEAVVSVLLRDSTFWFTASILIWIITFIVLVYAPIGLHWMGIPFFLAATCIAGCRMVLNVRWAYYHYDDDANALGVRGCTDGLSGGNEDGIDTFRVASRSMIEEMEWAETISRSRDLVETGTIELQTFTTSARSISSFEQGSYISPAWDNHPAGWNSPGRGGPINEVDGQQGTTS